jgi:hypothetical protein
MKQITETLRKEANMKRYLLIISVVFMVIFISGLFQSAESGLFDKTEITEAKILKYGICTATKIKKVSAKTASGKMNIQKDMEFIENTTEIPATIGTSFGIRWVVKGKPEGRQIKLRVKGIHPPMKRPKKEDITTYEYTTKIKIGSIGWNNYTFERDGELLPGKWTFQIYYKDRKLLEKTFNVYLP